MPLLRRLLISLLIGSLAALACDFLGTYQKTGAGDFSWPLRGARTLLSGGDPYHDPGFAATLPNDQDAPLYYPLPALFVALPFAPLPNTLAGALFFGLSSALLAWGLLNGGHYWRLLIFASAPYWKALDSCNWVVLVTAAFLIPGLEWLYVTKPNIGLAFFAARPSKRVVILCAAALGISLLVRPLWPLGVLDALKVVHEKHLVPIMVFPGFLIFLAALRWRDEKARLLLVLGLVPQQLLFYDQLPLALIPSTPRQLLIIILLGWCAPFGLLTPISDDHWIVTLLFLPPLFLVLRPLLTVESRQEQTKKLRSLLKREP